MTIEADYISKQFRWVEDNNIKVGDRVKILRKAESYEYGWGTYWVSNMNDFIGGIHIVDKINRLGIKIKHSSDDMYFAFPYFVLEKVEPVEVKPAEIIIQPSKTYSLKEARKMFRK